MGGFSILQFGDAHLDQGNLDLTLGAIEAIADRAEAMRPDLSIFTGDGFVRRGHLHPEPIYRFRLAMERIGAASRFGLVCVDGNHDLMFDGSVSSLWGVLVGTRAPRSESLTITAVSDPQVLKICRAPGERAEAVLVAVPTVDRLRLAQYVERLDAENLRTIPDVDSFAEVDAVELAIRSMIAEAHGVSDGAPVIVAYHGSLAGATLGNEQSLRAGIDVQIRGSAFHGADLVCLGHIHKAQRIPGPVPIWYNGPIAPLTWGEANVRPVVLEHKISTGAEGAAIETIQHPIPVSYQMLEASVEFVSSDNPLADLESLVAGGSLFPAGSELLGSRVRLNVRGPRSVLDLLKNDEVERFFIAGGVRDVTIIRDPIEEETSRIATEDRKINLFDAVALWYRLRPEDLRSAEEEARLMALAAEVEGLVRDDDLDARYDFRPLLLTVQNWAQFESAEIDFTKLGGIVAVRGPNTAGKSNLVRAIPFALFKTQEAGDVLSDLIRQGADKAAVSLVFKSRGGLYRITRKLRRGKSRGAAQTLVLEHYRPQQGEAIDVATTPWQICNEGDEAATQKKIESLVGSREIFEGTIYAGQDSVSSLLALPPAGMKDLLATVLHRDFAGRIRIVAERRLAAEREIEKLRAVLAVSDEDQRKRAELEAEVEACAAEIAALREELEKCDPQAGEAMIVELSEESARLQAELATRKSIVDRLNEVTGMSGDDEAEVAKLRNAMKKADEVRLMIAALPEFTLLDDEWIENMGQAAAELRRQREEIAERSRAEIDDLKQKRNEASATWKVADAEERRIRDKLVQIRRDRELLGGVPCAGGVWQQGRDGFGVDMGKCQFIGDATKRADLLGETELALETILNQKQELAAASTTYFGKMKELQEEADRAVEPLAREASRLSTEISAALKARADAKATTDRRHELERKLAGWVAIAGPAVDGDIRHLEEEIANLATAADELAGKLKAFEPMSARVEEIAMTIARIKTARLSAERRRDELSRQIEGLAEKKARAEGGIAQIATRAAETDDRRAELEREGAAIRIFTLYEQACGRDGVPFLLLERFAIPAIAAAVNRYLEPTGFRVEVESDRASVTAGMKSGVFFFFSDARGRHPVSASSGFQTDSIGSALRNAVADLHASATGTTLRCAIQDEGFGSYDFANIMAARGTIRRIAAERELFLLVSHVGGLSEIADWVIDVVPRDGRSEISITRGS